MPKRGVIALVVTAGALVLLLSFRTPDAPATATSADASAIAADASPTVTPTLGIAEVPAAGSGAVPPTATPAPAVTRIPTATEAPATDGTVAGDAIRIRWGYVQVQVTVANGEITDVTTLQIPTGDPRSAQINGYAEPYLRESALQSQSASIDYVSGATFTSRAYAQSLRSALDRASLQG